LPFHLSAVDPIGLPARKPKTPRVARSLQCSTMTDLSSLSNVRALSSAR